MEETERKPIFTNLYTPNDRTSKQLYQSITGVRSIVLLALCTVFFAVILYQIIDEILYAIHTGTSFFAQPVVWLYLLAAALYIGLFVALCLGPRRYVKRQAKMARETYGDRQVQVASAFFDDEAAFHNLLSDAKVQFAYPAFTKATETKDLFLLWTKQKQVLAFDKDSFEGVDIIGFRAFIDEKCPNAKRKWKKGD